MCRRQVVLPGGIGGTNQELNGTLSLFIKRPDDRHISELVSLFDTYIYYIEKLIHVSLLRLLYTYYQGF